MLTRVFHKLLAFIRRGGQKPMPGGDRGSPASEDAESENVYPLW